MTSIYDDDHHFWADCTTEEHALIKAWQQYRSAYARHYGITRLGHDDRHAMPLASARRRLRAAQDAARGVLADDDRRMRPLSD